jgi:excisionase family DNA binding protein
MGRRKEAVKSAVPDLSRKIMLRPGEAALLLGVHVNTIRRWADQGILIPYRIGSRGDRRFRRTELESFLKQGRQRWER